MQVDSSGNDPKRRDALCRTTQEAFHLAPNDQSEGIFDLIFTTSPSFMSIVTGPEHVYQRANPRFYEFTGLDVSIIGKTVREASPELEAQGFIALLDEAYRTGRSLRQTETPLTLKSSDGRERLYYVDFVYHPFLDDRGRVSGIVRQGYDVTEKVLARQAIEKSKNAVDNERSNFLNLFKQTPEMVCILRGPNHVFEFVNEAHIRALGFDATGMAVGQAQPDSVEVHGILDEVYRTGETAELREIPVTVTGRLRYFNLTYAARRDEKGGVNGVMILGAEVTDQVVLRQSLEHSAQQLERAVKERTFELYKSKKFLDSVVENIPNMVFVKDAKELRFIRFNRAGEELLGIPRSELIGKNDCDFFPKEQADHFVAKDREVLSGRAILDIPEETIATKGNGWRILHTRKIPIFGEDGKPEFLLGISEDITERKKAEIERMKVIREQAALEERSRENERVKFLSDASMILAASLDYHKTLAGLAELVVPVLGDWCTITLVQENQVKKRVAATHKDARKRCLIDELGMYDPVTSDETTGIGQVIKTGKSLFTRDVSDDHLVSAAQGKRHLEIMRELGCSSCMVVPITARGRTLGAIAIVSSERSRAYNENDLSTAEELGRRAGIAIDNVFLFEAAQKAVRVRDEFMSIASHELKTPLTSLKLQVQMRSRELKKGDLRRFSPEKLPQLVDGDDRQLNRLVRLVDDMLDVSRIQTGKLSLSAEEFDLNEMLKEALSRFAAHVEAHGGKVTFRPGDAVTVSWDRYRMEQVFINLLTNALKYGQGQPIEVWTQSVDSRVRIYVKDQGIGIDEKDRRRIFGQFERAVSGNSISGLGVGLYISQRIVSGHGGEIRVESSVGRGSIFIVDIPIFALNIDQKG